MLSDKCDLYRHFDKDGKLLYVGISNSTILRINGHRSNSEWWDQVVRIDIEHFRTREEALFAENVAITIENPVHNLSREGRKGPASRSPEIERARQVVIAKAKELNVKIQNGWCLSRLEGALKAASKGIKFPYQ